MGLLSVFGFGCKKAATKPTTEATSNAAAKEDGTKLIDSLLPFAEKILQSHKEFFPYGAQMMPDGKISQIAASDGSEHPQSQTLIDMLTQVNKKAAKSKSIRASATFYDIRTIPPGKTEKQDAISVAIDHQSGYSVVVIFPYYFDMANKLIVEAPFATDGRHEIFTN